MLKSLQSLTGIAMALGLLAYGRALGFVQEAADSVRRRRVE